MLNSKLYCPPYTLPNVENHLVVHSTERIYRKWMSKYDPNYTGGPRYEWYGDVTKAPESLPALNRKFWIKN